MADAPVKSAFDTELDGRVAAAKAAMETAHKDLFPEAAADPAAVAAIEVETPPAELPATGDAGAETPPAETPAAAPNAETAPVAAAETPATPAAAAPAKQPPQDMDWRALRQQKREIQRLTRELDAMKAGRPAPVAQPAATPAAAPVAEPDPIDSLFKDGRVDDIAAKQRELEENQAAFIRQQQAQNQQVQMQAQRNQIAQEEVQFRATHPDYDGAIRFMVDRETARYIRSGLAAAHGKMLYDNPQLQPVVEKIADDYVAVADVTAPTGVRYTLRAQAAADARDITDDEAAQLLATDLWIDARRNDVLAGAQASRRPVPEMVWDTAQAMGYTPQTAVATSTAPAAQPSAAAPVNGASVAERVRAQARATAAGKSISQVSGSGGGEHTPVAIRTMAEWMALRQKDPAAARQYMDEMSARNPNWHRELIA